MRKKRTGIVLLMAGLLFGTGGTYAYYRSSAETVNKIATGDVNIGITEYEEGKHGEKKYEGPEDGIVLPSQVISKIPRITNYAAACYIRVKPVFPENAEGTEEKEKDSGSTSMEGEKEQEEKTHRLQESDLGGISEKWKKAGEYYYYPDILQKKDSVDFFQSVTIPADWTSAASGQILSVGLCAEAVQAANFTPDFSSEDPWKGLEAEQCVHETDNVVSEVTQNSFLSVVYEGAARNLVLAPDNFFRNHPVLMPGDETEDVFTLSNTTAGQAEFYLRTEVPETLETEEQELLSKIELEIRSGSRIWYQGDLKADALQEAKSLGVLKSGEQEEISFSLHMPSELKNEWAMRKSAVKWIFSVEGEELREEAGPAIWHKAPKTGLRDPLAAVPVGIAVTGAVLFLAAGKPGRRKK